MWFRSRAGPVGAGPSYLLEPGDMSEGRDSGDSGKRRLLVLRAVCSQVVAGVLGEGGEPEGGVGGWVAPRSRHAGTLKELNFVEVN